MGRSSQRSFTLKIFSFGLEFQQDVSGGGGWDRTNDQQVMSPLL